MAGSDRNIKYNEDYCVLICWKYRAMERFRMEQQGGEADEIRSMTYKSQIDGRHLDDKIILSPPSP